MAIASLASSQCTSGGFRGGKGGANAASNVYLRTLRHESIKWLCSSGMKQQQPGPPHSRISSLLISRRLT